MSEVKGTLLTIILALTVFGIMFGVITVAVQNKANDVSRKIDEAGQVSAPAAGAAAAATNALTYGF